MRQLDGMGEEITGVVFRLHGSIQVTHQEIFGNGSEIMKMAEVTNKLVSKPSPRTQNHGREPRHKSIV